MTTTKKTTTTSLTCASRDPRSSHGGAAADAAENDPACASSRPFVRISFRSLLVGSLTAQDDDEDDSEEEFLVNRSAFNSGAAPSADLLPFLAATRLNALGKALANASGHRE